MPTQKIPDAQEGCGGLLLEKSTCFCRIDAISSDRSREGGWDGSVVSSREREEPQWAPDAEFQGPMSDRAVPRAARHRLRAGRRIALAIVALFALPLAFTSVAAAQAEPYKVLVFTKNATVGASEGAAALQAAVDPAVVTVDVTADASRVHRREPGHLPRRRVPQHERRRARRRAADRLRELLPRRRRLPRHPLGDRDGAELAVHDQHPRHALQRPHRCDAGDGQGRRSRPRREQAAARVLGPV